MFCTVIKNYSKMETQITSEVLKEIGFPENRAFGIALELAAELNMQKKEYLEVLTKLLESPQEFTEHQDFGNLAQSLMDATISATIDLRSDALEYSIYGKEGIADGALKQMETAMKLPVATGGALMPDAHQGYGLPIGGVLSTSNSVIPYAVGVDIGCRMCMSIYDIPSAQLETNKESYKKLLMNNSQFGRATFKHPKDHPVLADKLFDELPLLSALHHRAFKQIGTSGGGNHFVEFGEVEIVDPDNEYGIPLGKYLALLSHSGSRGLGASIAKHYTKLARELCKLPQEAKHLAWLDLETTEGQEYWLAMNLAGAYASACHEQIHNRMAIGLRTRPWAIIENHHNFAWEEKDVQGNAYIVHRKGATPASEGVLGIVPGSMAAPGFIVRGKGNAASLNSASHGAGRQMSRTQAKKSLNSSYVAQYLEDHGIELIGAGLDEAPQAYKDIKQVMAAQRDLVEVVGTFLPKIVRMCGDERFKEVD